MIPFRPTTPILSGSEQIGDYRPLGARPNAYMVFLCLPGYAKSIALIAEAGETIADALSCRMHNVTWLVCSKPDGWTPGEFEARCIALWRSLPSCCHTPLPVTP